MNKGTQGCMYNCGDACTGECLKPVKVTSRKSSKQKIRLQQELIDLYEQQIMDLTLMSKIELGDDVIEEIKRLKTELNEKTTR